MTGPKLLAYVSDDFEEKKILEESFQKSIFLIKMLSRKKNPVFFYERGLSPPHLPPDCTPGPCMLLDLGF